MIDQVRDHLKGLPVKDRAREFIYNHFLAQCNQYEISEEDFYKQVLKQAFKEAAPAPEEDPDPPNRKGTFVKIFGETLHSLQRLGAVLFEDADRAKIYFDDVTFLKAHVDHLEDADRSIAYTLLYQSERDPESRYLKVCYQLNPALPYRIGGELFASLKDLFAAGFRSRPLMDHIYRHYCEGKLHVWLAAREPEKYFPVPESPTVLSFLSLIYGIDGQYPFYIGAVLFHSPAELVQRAEVDLSFWKKLITRADNGQLFVWFDALGHPEWRGKYQKAAEKLELNKTVLQDDRDLSLVQKLLLIIDPETSRPLIELSEMKIELPELQAARPVEVPVTLRLKTKGFVRVRVDLSSPFEGIWLDTTDINLFDLSDQRQVTVTLHIDPQQITKNAMYESDLRMVTDYETLTIPISLKAVFPLRTYLLYLAKYALFGGLFLGVLRWLISAGTDLPGGLPPRIITGEVVRSLPDNWPVFFWVFLVFITGLIGSYFLIRKTEQL